jgi:MFS transporter, DHA1 family, tetracycline resistance protein
MIDQKLKFYTFASLFLVLVIDSMGIGLVFPLLGPLFISKTSALVPAAMSLGSRDLLYGITLAIFCVFMFLGAPFFGDLSDHIGRKKVLLICLFCTAGGLALSAIGIIIKSLSFLIIGRVVAGFASGSQALAEAAIVDISTEATKAVNLALISFASCLGFAIGPIISGYLASEKISHLYGFSTPFWVAAFLALLNGVMLIFTFKETFHPGFVQKLHLTRGVEIFISAFTNKRIRKLAIIYLMAEFGWALFFQVIPLYVMKTYDYSTVQIGHVMALMGVVFGISCLFIIRVVMKFFSTKQIAFYSIIITGVGMLAMLFNVEWVMWALFVPVSMGGALFYVVLLTLFSDSVGDNSQGWVMGVFAAIVAVSWSLSGVLSGVLSAINFYIPFIFASICLLISAVLVRI